MALHGAYRRRRRRRKPRRSSARSMRRPHVVHALAPSPTTGIAGHSNLLCLFRSRVAGKLSYRIRFALTVVRTWDPAYPPSPGIRYPWCETGQEGYSRQDPMRSILLSLRTFVQPSQRSSPMLVRMPRLKMTKRCTAKLMMKRLGSTQIFTIVGIQPSHCENTVTANPDAVLTRNARAV